MIALLVRCVKQMYGFWGDMCDGLAGVGRPPPPQGTHKGHLYGGGVDC